MAADQGLAEAQYEVGLSFEQGIGTEKSNAEAKRYYQLSADQGNRDAKYGLARLYAKENHT
jgi:TPR repeat protein